jgi:hypothetical protein
MTCYFKYIIISVYFIIFLIGRTVKAWSNTNPKHLSFLRRKGVLFNLSSPSSQPLPQSIHPRRWPVSPTSAFFSFDMRARSAHRSCQTSEPPRSRVLEAPRCSLHPQIQLPPRPRCAADCRSKNHALLVPSIFTTSPPPDLDLPVVVPAPAVQRTPLAAPAAAWSAHGWDGQGRGCRGGRRVARRGRWTVAGSERVGARGGGTELGG